ncbi:CASP-like protein 4D1 [Vigna radiata var. radiata]|uniref:CASP-like protein n=1 Tax=Vigna radiata var. radiata TaxID=3916 RepID=A0A3Q0EXX5_VIGRR|nr:CASP-like protein 4D1 [Vigna radiata var. radiata]
MVTKAVANSMLFLRIVTLAASAASVALLFTNKVRFDDGTQLRFQDFYAFRYEAVVGIIGGAYCILQLPFAIYYSVQQKRLIRNGCLPEFDFFGDKVISVLLGTGVGVGFGVSLEFKKFFDDLFDSAGVLKSDPTRKAYDRFFVRAIVASAILLAACLSMIIVSLISSINRNRSKGFFN